MNYILFDGPARNALLPFTFTRPVADILGWYYDDSPKMGSTFGFYHDNGN